MSMSITREQVLFASGQNLAGYCISLADCVFPCSPSALFRYSTHSCGGRNRMLLLLPRSQELQDYGRFQEYGAAGNLIRRWGLDGLHD